MFNSKQNRAADPFMIDHMLVQGGFSSSAHTEDFVNKYNARVKFDDALMLKDGAAKRQANMADPVRFHPDLKKKCKQRVDRCGGLEGSGITTTILGLPTFWAGECFTNSQHTLLRQLCTSSHWSSDVVVDAAHEFRVQGQGFTAMDYNELAKKVAVYKTLVEGVWKRKKVPETVMTEMLQKIRRGAYDDDIKSIIADIDISDNIQSEAFFLMGLDDVISLP